MAAQQQVAAVSSILDGDYLERYVKSEQKGGKQDDVGQSHPLSDTIFNTNQF